MANTEDLLSSISCGDLDLVGLFAHCTGAAAKLGGRVILLGETPRPETVEKLFGWLHENVTDDVWATDCLSGFIPEMRDDKALASGILVSFLTHTHEDAVLWFRPESEEVVVWAGNPNEKNMRNGNLLPRKRFEHWVELKSAHSRPWGAWKLELAKRLSQAMMAVLSAQFMKLKILNEKLELASSVKDRFLAQMSHELRTPLNAVLGFSELIASGLAGPTTPKQNEYLNDVLLAGNHLLSLINDILEMSKLEAGKYVIDPVALDAATLAMSVSDLLGPQAVLHEVNLSCYAVDGIPFVADERCVIQILMNLLSNAIKFTPAGGTVDLVVFSESEGVTFVVTDTGVGMDTAVLSEIGTPFFQAKSAYMAPPGTGLGLSIVKALVKESRGT
ncbi:MAG: histidine kinase dimerization/phospho-acceptor domain-containing protein, partial [Oligoflexus sp.]